MSVSLKLSQRLPLFDNPFLSSQLWNVEQVNAFLQAMEEVVRSEMFETERTPSSALELQAFTQMWVFAFYELLRTWRQMVSELLEYSKRFDEIGPEGAMQELRESARGPGRSKFSLSLEETFYTSKFERLAEPDFVESLRSAFAVVAPLFKQLELVRVGLAKHEIPGRQTEFDQRSYFATIARIDYPTGSLTWFIEDREGETHQVVRAHLWDQLLELAVGPETGPEESD